MSTATSYLVKDRIDELAAQLEKQGYDVTVPLPADADRGYDLVATKGDERIAFDVKALSSLAESNQRIGKLRNRAFHEGFTEFRLVVVSPPHQTSVSVSGLENELAVSMREHVPSALPNLASNTRIESVRYLEIDAITVTKEGIDLAGKGVVELTLEFGESRDGTETAEDFPFRFHALMGHDLHLARVRELDVDVSSYSV